MLHSFSIPRDLAAISPLSQSVTALMVPAFDQDARDAVDLALVEALSNAVQHGTKDSAKSIGLEVVLTETEITLDIIDSTPPMPLFLLEDLDPDALEVDPDDLENLPETGRGLALIVMMMDEVAFHHIDDQTRLRLTRRR
ncbi:ATP-binding protein [Paragemmobacter straminiformis]|uniref:ATP-binding protein n=1 Tax=Paragemmobacter straminiformis TaxID=2045119 RepID=A0A842IE38_9RHOB|nr:ATP-binding protein [Gemmobacter straminiformis]MBC2837447.1 ATP-binding protein [Gemmobacter straminiformis]